MEQTKNVLTRMITYMKKPEFLLMLGLVNLLGFVAILGGMSKFRHMAMKGGFAGKGYQQESMMRGGDRNENNKGRDLTRGQKGMMNKNQYNAPQNNQNPSTPPPQATPTADTATGSTGGSVN